MFGLLRAPAPVLVGALLLAGCSSDGGLLGGALTTASVPDTPKIDPACVTLTSQIEGLRKDGVAEKVEKAAAKKYKMTAADLAKADQLNKANADYQARCGVNAPAATTAAAGQAQVAAASPKGTTTQMPLVREPDGN